MLVNYFNNMLCTATDIHTCRGTSRNLFCCINFELSALKEKKIKFMFKKDNNSKAGKQRVTLLLRD